MADHSGAPVTHLRTVEDSDHIRSLLRLGRRLVIVGGGWIGLEVAAAARNAGAHVTVLEALAVLAAGVGAGTINAAVGSGTLITFPVLLAVGYSPVVANVSNTIGLVPGSVTGAIGYRRELSDQGPRLRRLVPASTLGGICGAIALLTLPAGLFEAIVPVMIAVALVLIVFQPRLSALVARPSALSASAR